MALALRHKPRVSFLNQRSFSISAPRKISLQWEKNDPEALADAVPPYPYPTHWYKQSRLGLYGGQRIQFGNNVGKKIEVKTRRSWHPNVVNKKLFSKALERRVQVRVTARVLRTIEKCGGLDEYLLGEKEARIKTLGESGWWLRWAIMRTSVIQNRFAMERAALGLQSPESAMISTGETTQSPESGIEEDASVNLLEEASEEEAQLAMEEGESVTSDDAFTIETGPGLPPLKFRVGPGKHVVLTPTGWKRTRPHPLRWILMDKEKIAKKRNIEEKVKNRTSTELRHFQNELNRKINLHNKAVANSATNSRSAESSFAETVEDQKESLTNSIDLASLKDEAFVAPNQEKRASNDREGFVRSQDAAYTKHISNYNRDRMLEEARQILKRTYNKAAHQAVDRAYEAHVVMRDTKTERRRLAKTPQGFDRNHSKEKAAMRKSVIAEH